MDSYSPTVPRHLAYTGGAPAARIQSISQLPARLLSHIVDQMSIPDMFQFARTCLLIQDVVYDESRWIRRLQSMGCWDEDRAKERDAQVWKDKMSAKRARRQAKLTSGTSTPSSQTGVDGSGRKVRFENATLVKPPSAVLIDVTDLEEQPAQASPSSEFPGTTSDSSAGREELTTLDSVESVHGRARSEFGRVYGALAPYYLDLVGTGYDITENRLFRRFPDPEHQAVMFCQLQRFSKSDWSFGNAERSDRLCTKMGTFENLVLMGFEHALDAGDFGGLARRSAKVLVVLNGGTLAIDSFLQKRQLILLDGVRDQPSDCFDPVTQKFSVHRIESFFRQLSAGINAQTPIIEQVFPQNVSVFLPLVERLSEDVVADYLGTLFDRLLDRDPDGYIHAVAFCFELCGRLFKSLDLPRGSPDDLQAKCERAVLVNFEPHLDRYFTQEVEVFKAAGMKLVEEWDRQLDDRQTSAETGLVTGMSKQAAKNDFMSTFKKMVMFPVNVVTVPFSSSTAAGAGPGDETGTAVSVAGSAPPTSELAAQAAVLNSRLAGMNSLVSIEVTVQLTQLAKGCVERIARFVSLPGEYGKRAREQCELIFVALLDILGGRHVQAGFDKAIGHLSAYRPRHSVARKGRESDGGPVDHGDANRDHRDVDVEPLVLFVELVNLGDLIQQMVDVFYLQELVAQKLTDEDDFLSRAGKEKKRFELMVDDRVAAGLGLGIDVLMAEVEYICGTTQKPWDYNPSLASAPASASASSDPADTADRPGHPGLTTFSASGAVVVSHRAGAVVDIGPTATAVRVVQVVKDHLDMLVGSTEKNMLHVFNQEVGIRLFGAVCKHIKTQRVSEDGAVRLICDLNHYSAFVGGLRNGEVNEYFAALRQVGQLFLVPGPGSGNGDGGGGVQNGSGVLDRAGDGLGLDSSTDVDTHSGTTIASSTPSAQAPPLSSTSSGSSSSGPGHTRSRTQSSFGLGAFSSLSLFSKPKSKAKDQGRQQRQRQGQGQHPAAKDLAALIADHDRYGGVFTPQEVYEFAARRADWLDIKADVERAMYGVGCVVM